MPRLLPSATTSTTSTTSSYDTRCSSTSTPSSSNCVHVPFDEWHSQTVHGRGGSSGQDHVRAHRVCVDPLLPELASFVTVSIEQVRQADHGREAKLYRAAERW